MFHYDEAGTVTLSPSAGAPLASGMPVSVGNQSLLPSDTAVIVPLGSSTSSVQLFPYTTGYSVWYGDCTTQATVTQEQPAGPATFSLSPKGTTSVLVTGLPTLAITITRTGGAAFTGLPTATATVNDTAAPGDGCPSVDKTGGEVFTLAGAAPTTTGSTTSYTTQTAIMYQTYTVTVHDPTNNSNTAFAMVVGASNVSYGGNNYAYGTAVPVVVS